MSDVSAVTRSPPMRRRRWLRALLLALAWAVALIASVCRDWAPLLVAGLLGFTLASVLWANQVTVGRLDNVRALGALLVGVVADGALLLLFLGPMLLVLPMYGCYSDRAIASEIVNMVASTRLAITEQIRKSGSISGSGVDVAIGPERRLVYGFVTEDGTIVAVGEDPAVVFFLAPRLEEGEVQWSCVGFPTEIVPSTCRIEGAIPRSER